MTQYIIDSHAHLDDEKFDQDREEVIAQLEENKIKAVINPASDLASSKRAVDLSSKYDRIFAMVGSHPHEAKFYDQETRKTYVDLAKKGKVVAVGEIGLDYYYDFSDRDLQKKVFIDQIQLARDLSLPIVIHSRDAIEDTYDILESHAKGLKVLLHAFSESWEVCERYLKLGFYIGLGGVVTFKNARKLLEVGKKVPLDRLLIETDSPYLTPVPFRGKRNQPAYTHYVVEKLAELKGVDPEVIRDHAYKNTLDFFGISL
ncbi:MAG: TatD family hydrolase [Tissierellia bacterium]|nr:TatD family hydrolase [Tissierellia bacterium]